MTMATAVAIAGVSLAVATFIKYGFQYLTERKYKQIYKEAVAQVVRDNQDEIKDRIVNVIISRRVEANGEIRGSETK